MSVLPASGGGEIGGAGVAEQADDQVVEGGHHPPGVAARQAGGVLVEGDITPVMQPVLNGLITNDKICFVQVARLPVTPARSRRHDGPDGATADNPLYSPAEMDQPGGSDGTAAMACAAGSAGHAGRAPALGPGLPVPAEVDGGEPRAGGSGKSMADAGGRA